MRGDRTSASARLDFVRCLPIDRTVTGSYMSIRARLYATAVAAAVIVCAVSGLLIATQRSLSGSLERMESEAIPLIDSLHTLRFAALRMVSSTNEFALVQMERRHTPDPGKLPSTPDTDEVSLRNAAAQSFGETLESFEALIARTHPDRQETAAHVDIVGRELTAASEEVLKAVTSGADATTVLAKKERLETAEQDLLKSLDGLLAMDGVDYDGIYHRASLGAQAGGNFRRGYGAARWQAQQLSVVDYGYGYGAAWGCGVSTLTGFDIAMEGAAPAERSTKASRMGNSQAKSSQVKLDAKATADLKRMVSNDALKELKREHSLDSRSQKAAAALSRSLME